MTDKKKLYKTYATAKVNLFEPTKKAIAMSSTALEQINEDKIKKLLPQTDLLYVRSVLVTAGMNANDDVFFVDELWKARLTPMLKPFDWKHNEQEIIGVMYNVAARNLGSGDIISMDINDYNEPFEIISEGVIYSLLFPGRASEISREAKAGRLFVSMECWFDDYDYVIFDGDNIERIIRRNDDTCFLDASLKAFGGDGFFEEPEDRSFKRIGRGLRNLTFGGCGFVPRPANKRSVIEAIGYTDGPDSEIHNECIDAEQDLVCACDNKEVIMTDKNLIKASMEEILDERAEADRIKDLEEKAKTLATVQEEKNSLEAQIELMTRQRDSILTKFTDTMQEIVKIVAAEAPPEIAAIDAAIDDPEALFNAMLSWIQNSVKSMAEKVEASAQYKEKLDELAKAARKDEIVSLLADVVNDEEALSGLVENALAMDDEVYTKWFDEKKLLVNSMKTEASEDSGEEGSADDESSEEENTSSNEEGEEESAEANEDEEVSEEALDDVEEDEQPNLAGVANEPEDDDPTGVKQLAADLYPTNEGSETEENENEDEGSEFDFLSND